MCVCVGGGGGDIVPSLDSIPVALGSLDYEYEIEYEYDFSILVLVVQSKALYYW